MLKCINYSLVYFFFRKTKKCLEEIVGDAAVINIGQDNKYCNMDILYYLTTLNVFKFKLLKQHQLLLRNVTVIMCGENRKEPLKI